MTRDEAIRDLLSGAVGRVQWIRGMCSDEADHRAIDAKLFELRERLYDIREALEATPQQLSYVARALGQRSTQRDTSIDAIRKPPPPGPPDPPRPPNHRPVA